MRDTASENTRILMDVMMARGVKSIVLSPGSRNAPLLIAAEARPELRKYMVADERTAAFTALGMALVSKQPVAIACTSGTALYNYAPAVAEAYYQRIPLIVISADRPAQWIDQDDSQTLRQFGALSNIVKESYNIPLETEAPGRCANPRFGTEKHWFVNRLVNEAMTTATTGLPGPVHINIQLDNPLGGMIDREPDAAGDERTVTILENRSGLPQHTLDELCREMMEKKILVVAGFMQPDDRLNSALNAFATLPNVTMMCETISNIHAGSGAYMIDSLLTRLSAKERERLKPDLVISIGGALVSRMLKEYLRGCEGLRHWKLADSAVASDCFQRLDMQIECEPARFFRGAYSFITHRLKKGTEIAHPGFACEWEMARKMARETNQKKLKGYGWSELTALRSLLGSLPSDFNLFLSNGTPIRYSQICMGGIPHACYCNRGVSGIDGTNATAFGVATASKRPTLLVTGDLSFSYCPQILGMKETAPEMRIVVVNNSGGGIFRFIRTTRDLPMREEYFCAPPVLPLEKLCEAYGCKYLRAETLEELEEAKEELLKRPHTLLEIAVDPQQSADVLIDYLG